MSDSISIHNSPPPKRVKLDPDVLLTACTEGVLSDAPPPPPTSIPLSNSNSNTTPEHKVGITGYLTPGLEGFTGVLKQRYTDFLVNEIGLNGEVIHLKSLGVPKKDKAKKEREVVATERSEGEVPQEKKLADEPTAPATPVAEEGPVEPDPFELSSADSAFLTTLLGHTTLTSLLETYSLISSPAYNPRQSQPPKPILTPSIDEKSARTELHKTIRRVFSGKFETTTIDSATAKEGQENVIQISISRSNGAGVRGRGGREPIRSRFGKNKAIGGTGEEKSNPYPEGEYLYFTLYKENRDTMDMINMLSRIVNLPKHLQNKTFAFAGTKDKRAVTVQRCSAYKITPERLAKANFGGGRGGGGGGGRGGGGGLSLPPRCKVGDFTWSQTALSLGALKGNEFLITLRSARAHTSLPTDTLAQQETHLRTAVSRAVSALEQSGFINYYGLQRFGTFNKGTHEVGIKMLKKDWKGAVDEIMDYNLSLATLSEQDHLQNSQVSKDEYDRARACHIFATTSIQNDTFDKNLSRALDILPRKFLAENTIIRGAKERAGSTSGATQKLDYFQLLMRIPRGLRLMYIHSYQSYIWNHAASQRITDHGTTVIPGDLVLIDSEHSTITTAAEPDLDTDIYIRARPVTEAEASSGTYTLTDIVLPTPGFDITYPQNDTFTVYKSLMEKDGLDPEDMRRSVKEISLSGAYRKVIGHVIGGKVEWDVVRYKGVEQVVETDLEKIDKEKAITSTSVNAMEIDTEQEKKLETEQEQKEEQDKEHQELAITIALRLGTSMYATMALREVMREGGVRSYQPEFVRAGG